MAAADGSFTATLAAQLGDVITLTSLDAAGNSSVATTITVVPPDPTLVAPPNDPTVATTLFQSVQFLFSGVQPIQTGVAPGTISPVHIAVVRGRVLDRDNQPLPGVQITFLDHPEFGQSLSRADGMFDLAINGGGALTLVYTKAGFLPVQRQVRSVWQEFIQAPDVVLVPLDTQVTLIDLPAATAIQVAQGSVVTDQDGTRQATLLFAPGTQASMTLPTGHIVALSTLHVRATEYTVGENGPLAMPAELPPTSAYTYAVELSVDEAIAAGATRVSFTQPVIVYVTNFLDFPVGIAAPVGIDDRGKAQWVPTPAAGS